VTDRPFPPGSYPVVVIGSGPGGLQLSHDLRASGVEHAVLSSDPGPAGMFRRFPLFQRLITWTKPYAPSARGTREYERYDWNSLLGSRPEEQALVAERLQGPTYFPARDEMEGGIADFVARAGLAVRYGCTWGSTERTDDGWIVRTSDGEYRARILVCAVGMTQAWTPVIPGIELTTHYVDVKEPRTYADRDIFIIGKRNSGFEVADALLPWARRIVLASPRPARISIISRTTAAARARYMQPYEDHVLGGGNVVLDAAIERIERIGDRFRVSTRSTSVPGSFTFETDEVIACTGFTTPMRDLAALGMATFSQGRLPSQTPFWESTSMPGLFFAGSITQGSIGLKKYGIPSNSAAVHGFRYNARVLAGHIARALGGAWETRPIPPAEVVDFLLREATTAPELWNQMSYLARVITFDPARGPADEGILPLAWFVDASGSDAVAVTVETNGEGDIRPAAYVRRMGRVEEHLLPGDPLLSFETGEHRAALTASLLGFIE